MLFVIEKPVLRRVIAIMRDDRCEKGQGLAGPLLLLEARGDYIRIDGLEAYGKIPATVYEPGVLFLNATQFRRLLPTFKGEKFLMIQVIGDELLTGYVRLSLETKKMLLKVNPDQAHEVHLAVAVDKPARPKRSPVHRPCSLQLMLWPKFDIEMRQLHEEREDSNG